MSSKGFDVSVLDTGPCLNFLGTGNGDVLLDVLASISAQIFVPEDVLAEVEAKASEINTYQGAAKRIHAAVSASHLSVLRSRAGEDPGLDIWVAKLLGVPRGEVAARAKDLGERMVVAHARTMQDRGQRVLIVINDSDGQKLAGNHGVPFVSTLEILRKAAYLGIIPDRATMRQIYERMQPHDYALLPIDNPQVQSALFAKSVVYGSQADRRTAASARASPSAATE